MSMNGMLNDLEVVSRHPRVDGHRPSCGGPSNDDDWAVIAKNLMRGQLAARGLTYSDLMQALAAIGVEETEVSIKNKVSRGRFSFLFFVQSMVAMGSPAILIPTLSELKGHAPIGRRGRVGHAPC